MSRPGRVRGWYAVGPEFRYIGPAVDWPLLVLAVGGRSGFAAMKVILLPYSHVPRSRSGTLQLRDNHKDAESMPSRSL